MHTIVIITGDTRLCPAATMVRIELNATCLQRVGVMEEDSPGNREKDLVDSGKRRAVPSLFQDVYATPQLPLHVCAMRLTVRAATFEAVGSMSPLQSPNP
jgi:hypothetical protein